MLYFMLWIRKQHKIILYASTIDDSNDDTTTEPPAYDISDKLDDFQENQEEDTNKRDLFIKDNVDGNFEEYLKKTELLSI